MTKKVLSPAGATAAGYQKVPSAGPSEPQRLPDLGFLEMLIRLDRAVFPGRRLGRFPMQPFTSFERRRRHLDRGPGSGAYFSSHS
jgi:hypothetical protein